MPNFENLFTAFLQKVNEINVLTGNQILNRVGNRIEKVSIRKNLCDLASEVASKVMGYANNEDLYLLYSEVNYVESKLLRMADTLCHSSCTIIWEKAKDNQSNLVAYGVTDELLDEFKAKIDLFYLSMPKPKAGILDKKLATENLKIAFTDASNLVKKMFGLVKMIKKQESDFYTNFINSKRIEKVAYIPLSASGVVVDVEGNRVGKVTMECKELNFKRKVTARGGFNLKHMEDGVYEFEFSRPGYETTKAEMIFYKGTRFKVVVVMKLI